MPEPGDLTLPPWLQRNIAPGQSYDPTPWLQERYNRQIEAQKLPLQLQGMALQNQAQQIAIEHQGMLNDVQNQQQQLYKSEFPVVRDWMASIAQKPIQQQLNDPGPAVTHPGLQKAVLDYKKQLADTEIARTFSAQQLETTKTANYLLQKGQPVQDAKLPDGTWDMQKISAMAKAEDESQKADALKLALAKQEHFGEDRNMREAVRVADLQSQIDASKAITDKAAEMTPEIQAQLDAQKKAQYELDALQSSHSTQLEAAGRFTAEMARADAKIKAAEDSGDPAALETARQEKANLSDYLSRTHPDKGKLLQEQAIKSRESAAYKAMLDAPNNKRVKEEYMKARKELDDYIGQQSAPTGNAAPVSGGATFKYVPGQGIIPK